MVFVLRFPGKTKALYIGRGHGYEGFYLSDKVPPSYLRIKDKLLDYMRKYLVGTRLGKITVKPYGLVSSFGFKNENEDNSLVFGYKEHQLFFIKREKQEAFISWDGQTHAAEKLEQLLVSFVGEKITTSDGRLHTIEEYLEKEEKKVKGLPLQKKKEKFLNRKLQNIKDDLQLVSKWPQIENDLLSEKIDLNSDSINIHGQKLKFHGVINPWLKKDLIFQKIKKLKKAQGILDLRLRDTENEYGEVQSGKFEFEITKEKAIAPLWNNQSASKKLLSAQHSVKYFRIKNINGVIALDAESNDWIRGQAAKEHWWFHIDQYTGSHLILKIDELASISILELSAIASCLRDYSKLNILSIPLVYSQVKHIKGVKGSQGKVIITKPKYMQCDYADWKEIITLL